MRHIRAGEFAETQYTTKSYDATVESGTTFEDIQKPEFWMHVADKLRPSFKVFVYAADQTFYAELLVLRANRVEAQVAVLNHVDLTRATNGDELGRELEKYDIGYAGPANKFRIVHRASRDVVRDGFDNEAAARTWLINEHLTQKRAATERALESAA